MAALQCSRCTRESSKSAEYVNLRHFQMALTNKERFVCRGCSNPKDSLIRIDPYAPLTSQEHNVSINARHPQAYQHRTALNLAYASTINDQLNQMRQITQKVIDQLEAYLNYQFQAVAGTFDYQLVEKFLRLLAPNELPMTNNPQIREMARAMYHAGNHRFDSVNDIINCTNSWISSIGSLIKIEGLYMQKRLSVLRDRASRLQIHRLYDQKVKASSRWKTAWPGPTKEIASPQPMQNPIEVDRNSYTYSLPTRNNLEIGSAYRNYHPNLYYLEFIDVYSEDENQYTPDPERLNQLRIQYEYHVLKNPGTIYIDSSNFTYGWDSRRRNKLLVHTAILSCAFRIYDAVHNLPEYPNLQEIIIKDPRFATYEFLYLICHGFPHLRRLRVLCNNNICKYTLLILAHKQINLQYFSWGCDFHGHLAQIDEMNTFKYYPKSRRADSLDNTNILWLLNQFKRLYNIWVSDLSDQSMLISIFYKAIDIKYLSLGSYEVEGSLSIESWLAIGKIKELQSLSLVNLAIDTERLSEVIRQNKRTLKCLTFYRCSKLVDYVLQCIYENCKSLAELAITKCYDPELQGYMVWRISSLETLIISSCNSFDRDVIINYPQPRSLHRLRHLSLFGNARWVDDKVMTTLCDLSPMLELLNLGCTRITRSCVHTLGKMIALRALHVGGTKILGYDAVGIPATAKELRKFSLSYKGSTGNTFPVNGMYYQKGSKVVERTFARNLKYMKSITHLDISFCKEIEAVSLFNKLPSLVLLDVERCRKVAPDTVKKLRRLYPFVNY